MWGMTDVIDNTELRKILGQNVRRLRKNADLTQTELAAKIGVSLVHLNRIEQGHAAPSAEVLFALADHFVVGADDLRKLPMAVLDRI